MALISYRGIALGIAALAGFLMCAVTPAASAVRKAEVFFESGGRIASMRADGSDRRILTRENAPFDRISYSADSDPRVSPDGKSILYSHYVDGDFSEEDFESVNQVVIRDLSDGSERGLFPDPADPGSDESGDGAAVWSADSERIFYIRYVSHARSFSTEVRSIGADGTGDRRISRSTMRFGKKKILGDRLLPLEIAPSPDGENLLVTYSRLYGGQPSRLFLMDAGTGKRRLIQKDAGGGSFSPDGSRIVFISERDRKNKSCYEGSCSFDPQTYLMKANGSGVRRLLRGPVRGAQYGPDWSADGGRIAFTSGRLDEIFSIRPDGKCLTRITNGSPGSGSPDWAPEAGLSSDPGTCGDAAPRPLPEIVPGPNTLGLKLPPMWLGPKYRNQLLSDIFKDGRAVTTSYDDCGALKAKRCTPPVQVTSGPVCEKLIGSAFYDGTFMRLVGRRGALVMLARPSGGGLESITYSGGTETAVYTRRKVRGKKVTWGDHLRVVDRMRPVTSNTAVESFEPAVFALTEVRKARAVLRSWKRQGSLAAAARRQRMLPGLAAAYLRFGKALDRRSKVLTVKCHRRKEVPGSLKSR